MDVVPVSSANSISQNTIQCIFKDSFGFMWFGTQDGLNKYDGYQMVVYKHKLNDKTSLPANHIMTILEDKGGDLWIGTRTGGLSRYNRKHDNFTNFQHHHSDSGSISANNVNVVYKDHNANLWVGTRSGLNLFNPATGKFKRFFSKLNDKNSLSDSDILSLFEDSQHHLWVGTDNGLNLLDPNKLQVKRFPDEKTFGNSINAITEDDHHNVWIGTNEGLRLLNKNNGTFTHFAIDKDKNSAGGINPILCFAKTQENKFWIGTNTTLQLFDVNKRQLIPLIDQTDGDSRLPNDGMYALLEDKNGVLWIGTTSEGVLKYDRNLTLFPSYKASLINRPSAKNIIRSLAEDNTGNFYVATDGGLDYFNRDDLSFKPYRHNPDDGTSLVSNYTTSVIVSKKNGDVWVGTYSNGLDRMTDKNGRFQHIVQGNGTGAINSNFIDVLLEDSKGNIWVGTDGGGVNVYDPVSKTFIKYINDPKDHNSICDNTVLCLLEDREGKIWIGGYSNGISIYNPKTKQFSKLNTRNSLLTSDIITALHEDPQGNIWIGTMGAGLNRYDLKTKKVESFTENDGLIDNTVNYIAEDATGRLWLSTNQGITCFKTSGKSFSVFGKHNNLKTQEFNQGAGVKLQSGEIVLGSINGFNIINPAKLAFNYNKPPVVITGFKLFNKPVSAHSNSTILNGNILTADQITLQFSQSVFTIEFAALDFTIPDKNNYAYKLDGFDKEWNLVKNQHEVTYTNLNPGNYTFRVKAANNDGIWNDKETTIRIRIISPYWMAWWFKALIGLLIAGGACSFYFYQIGFIKRQKVKLEGMVQERTIEIQQQTSDLKTLNEELQLQTDESQAQSEELQAQSEDLQIKTEELQRQSEELIQKTKSLELLNVELTGQKAEERKARLMAEQAQELADRANLAKSTFLATMSHEIRTPINGVLGMASLLAETKLDTEQQNYTEAILTSGESLLNVINDILDFSKIESGNLELEFHTFELRKCIENVTDLFGAKIADSGIDLVYQIDDAIPTHIVADSHRLGQVLINMVGNAIKFTKQGEVFIGVTLNSTSDQMLNIAFEVRDTGIGIAENQLVNLFKAFNQLDSSVTRKYGGTGLGLVICERLVKLMGGSIQVKSQPGSGTSFRFVISAAKGELVLHDEGGFNEISFEGKHALIVDDNAASLDMICNQLKSWKLNVTPVSSGEMAIKFLSGEKEIDLAITDMSMPGLDGMTLSQQIKSIDNDIPIVLLSAVGDESRKTHPHLFSSVLTKPIKYQSLFNAVKSALKKEDTTHPEKRKINLSEDFATEYPFNILVAEDILMNQKLILWILHKLGYKPELANNGLEVLEMLKKQSYDIILMDIQMPLMDGLETSRVIRRTYGSNPLILAMTANALSEDRENCFNAGMDDYISKPINIELLTKSLRELFSKKHSS